MLLKIISEGVLVEFIFIFLLVTSVVYLALRSLPYFQEIPLLPAQPKEKPCSASEAMKHAISCELQALKYLKELPEPQGPKLHMYYMEMADQWWLVYEARGGVGKKAGGASSS